MKNTITIALLVLFTSFGFSQAKKDIKYGIRAGYNISNLDFDPDATFDNQHRNGFAFGGFAEIPFSEKLFLFTELQWSAEGGKATDIRADYLNLPVMLRYAISENLTFGLGPQASLKTWKNRDGFKTFTFSGVAGLEYMISVDIFLDLRYSYGLTNILDDIAAPFEAKNNNIQIGIGMKI